MDTIIQRAESDKPTALQSRVDWLVDVIGDEIVSGVMEPGQKISEPRLSRRFGISRAPLREAIRRLEERHLVVRTPRLGARVASFSAEDFIGLFHVREGLEGIAARLAATHITQDELTALRKLCTEHSTKLSDAEKARALDLEFHLRIAQASRNAVLASILCNDFYAFFRICRRRYPREPGRAEKAFRQHIALLDALQDRDGTLAEYLMRRHVSAARASFEAVLEREARRASSSEQSENEEETSNHASDHATS